MLQVLTTQPTLLPSHLYPGEPEVVSGEHFHLVPRLDKRAVHLAALDTVDAQLRGAPFKHGSGPRRDRGERDGLLEQVCERDVVVCVAVRRLSGGTRSAGTRSGERRVVLFEEPLPDVLCLLPGRLVLSVVGRSGAR